jgi:hypothetical protein
LVFLRSRPTIAVPLGRIHPPLVLLNLYSMLSSTSKSKTESSDRVRVDEAILSTPAGEIAFAVPPSSLILNPGLLSTKCSPGNKRIVVLSNRSLSLPLT